MTNKEIAERLVEVKKKKEELEVEEKELKSLLLESKETVLLEKSKTKVAYQKGSEIKDVDKWGLWDYLHLTGRGSEFVEIASVTQSGIKKLKDKKLLEERFVVPTGKFKADSIVIKAMTKTELEG